MTDLRKIVRGRPCYMRLDGCTHNPEQTVLAHIRRGNVAGAGQKPSDLCAVPMCDSCHSQYDGRTRSALSRDQLDANALRALMQWLVWLEKAGHVSSRQLDNEFMGEES